MRSMRARSWGVTTPSARALAWAAIDRALALLQAIGLAPRDLSVANTALDAVLLVVLALIDGPHRLRVRAAADEQAAPTALRTG